MKNVKVEKLQTVVTEIKNLLECGLEMYHASHNQQENAELIAAYNLTMGQAALKKEQANELYLQLLKERPENKVISDLVVFSEQNQFVNPYAGGPTSWQFRVINPLVAAV